MGFPTHRRLLTWTAILVLVAQVGCAARSVPVTPSGVPVAISAADRTACEELARAEAQATAAAAPKKPPLKPGEAVLVGVGLLLNAVWLVPGLVVAGPFMLLEERLKQNRVREDAVYTCLDPVMRAATLGPDHPDVAWSLGNLADRYAAVGNDTHAEALYVRAEALYVRALATQEKAPETERSRLATTLSDYAALLRKTGKDGDAQELEARAQAIRRAIFPGEEALQDYRRGYFHAFSGNYAEAEPLYQRALRVQERMLPLGHEDVVRTLESYADLLRKTYRGPEAAELEIRAKEIREKHEPESRTGTGPPTQ